MSPCIVSLLVAFLIKIQDRLTEAIAIFSTSHSTKSVSDVAVSLSDVSESLPSRYGDEKA